MTHPTKAIYKWILSDFVKVSNIDQDDMLYDEKDVLASHERIEVVDYLQEVCRSVISASNNMLIRESDPQVYTLLLAPAITC